MYTFTNRKSAVFPDCRYSTYEKAREAAIKKVLELILEKGE